DFTIEAWIKRASLSQTSWSNGLDGVVYSATTSGSLGFGLAPDGRLFLEKFGFSEIYSTASVTDTNSFHHVAVAKSGSNVMFYLDGTGEAAAAYNPGFLYNSGRSLLIGAWYDGGKVRQTFLGTIDELSVYNGALADAEVQGIYVAGSSGKCTSSVPPYIISQPASQTVYVADTVTMSVVAGPDSPYSPLAYQWRFNGTNLAAASNTSITLTNVQQNQAGNYSVRLTNVYGAVVSANAALTVNPDVPPVFAVQPQSQSVHFGHAATFSSVVTGTPPFSYQWTKESVALPGATRSAWVVTNAQPSDAGTYQVVVTNIAGWATSAPAALTVLSAPFILGQPSSYAVPPGGAVSFVVSAEGAPPLAYQWRKDQADLSGATGQSLSLSNVQSSDVGSYGVVVSNGYGSVTSAPAVLILDSNLLTNCAVPAPGLVGWWPAEGNGNDWVGTNNGTAYPSYFVPGKIGQGFSLPPGNLVFLHQPSPSLQLQNFTIEVWIKRASASQSSWSSGVGGVIYAAHYSGGLGFG
ncbi:MAG: hypothetical protein DME25_18995, partial [Verrucomicrobia bacterium]